MCSLHVTRAAKPCDIRRAEGNSNYSTGEQIQTVTTFIVKPFALCLVYPNTWPTATSAFHNENVRIDILCIMSEHYLYMCNTTTTWTTATKMLIKEEAGRYCSRKIGGILKGGVRFTVFRKTNPSSIGMGCQTIIPRHTIVVYLPSQLPTRIISVACP